MHVRLGAVEGQDSARALAITFCVVDMVVHATSIEMQINLTSPSSSVAMRVQWGSTSWSSLEPSRDIIDPCKCLPL